MNAQAPIPVRNIYYLLCYAWQRLEEKDLLALDIDDAAELVDLFARVLLGGVRHLRRRGLDRGYQGYEVESSTIRGRIDLDRTLKMHLLQRGRVCSRYDQLTNDVLHNRILRSTLEHLASDPMLDRTLARDITVALRWFSDVSPVPLTPSVFRQVQLHRNNAVYGFLLDICRLIMERLLVSEQRGETLFRDFFRDDQSMRVLFETFVRSFYRHELDDCKVSAKQFDWASVAADSISVGVLPRLKSDVTIEGKSSNIILDTKYTPRALAEGQFGTQRLRTEHLYQIYAYVRNAEVLGDAWAECAGVLLYPSVGESFRYSYQMGAHAIRIQSVDLGAQWDVIRSDLFDAVRTYS